MEQKTQVRMTLLVAALVTATAALALTLRTSGIGIDGFWVDELFGASYCNLNPWELVIAVLRFDIHPPLYYLQLKLWSAPSASDTWLMLNSVAWSLATVLLVGFGVARRSGAVAGALSAMACSLLGSEIFYSNELRMYAMISCLLVLFWFVVRRKRFGDPGFPTLAAFCIITVLAATHSAAFLGIGSCLLYVMPRPLPLDRSVFGRLKPWLLFCCIVAAVVIPWMVLGSFRSVGHTTIPSLDSVSQTIGGWLIGYGALALPTWVRIGASLLVVIAVSLAIWQGSAESRRVLLCFVCFPLVFAAVFSFAIKPIWLNKTVAFCAPFAVVGCLDGVSSSLAAMSARLRSLAFAGLGAACAALAVLGYAQATTPWKEQYREAAQYLRDRARPNDTVYAPNRVVFWGIARYLAGPRWGSLLAVQDPVNPDGSDRWPRIYDRMGPAWVKRLHLLPSTRFVSTPNGRILIGDTPLPLPAVVVGYWLVRGTGRPAPNVACSEGTRETERKTFIGVEVLRCEASP